MSFKTGGINEEDSVREMHVIVGGSKVYELIFIFLKFVTRAATVILL